MYEGECVPVLGGPRDVLPRDALDLIDAPDAGTVAFVTVPDRVARGGNMAVLLEASVRVPFGACIGLFLRVSSSLAPASTLPSTIVFLLLHRPSFIEPSMCVKAFVLLPT